jgi:hypothetical protein
MVFSRKKSSDAKAVQPVFDEKGFCEMVHNYGRGYRCQGNELIKLCRLLSMDSKQELEQETKLSR